MKMGGGDVVEQLAFNMLEAEEPMQLCRPTPKRTVACHYKGQRNDQTSDEWFQVELQPHPSLFMAVTKQVGNDVALATTQQVERNEDIYDSSRYTIAGATTRHFAYQYPVGVTDGSFIRVDESAYDEQQGITFSGTDGVPKDDPVPGFSGLKWGNNAVLAFKVNNNGPTPFACNPLVMAINKNTRVSRSISSSGAQTAVGAHTSVVTTANPIGAVTQPSPDEIVCFCLVVTTTGTNIVKFVDIDFEPVLTNFLADDAYSVETFTLGQAVYGKDDERAIILDDFFLNSKQWGPIALSARLNISQELKDAGGKFLAALLPGDISSSLSPLPEEAWQQIVAFGRSYPVAEPLPFAEGCHGSWVPMSWSDFEMRKFERDESARLIEVNKMPRVVLIARKASAESIGKYMIDFQANFEVVSLNPLVTLTLGPSSPQFLSLYLALVSANMNLVGENPKHLERLWKIAQDVASNKELRAAASWAMKNGVPLLTKLIPMLI
jgi:hypothetical protein